MYKIWQYGRAAVQKRACMHALHGKYSVLWGKGMLVRPEFEKPRAPRCRATTSCDIFWDAFCTIFCSFIVFIYF